MLLLSSRLLKIMFIRKLTENKKDFPQCVYPKCFVYITGGYIHNAHVICILYNVYAWSNLGFRDIGANF